MGSAIETISVKPFQAMIWDIVSVDRLSAGMFLLISVTLVLICLSEPETVCNGGLSLSSIGVILGQFKASRIEMYVMNICKVLE